MTGHIRKALMRKRKGSVYEGTIGTYEGIRFMKPLSERLQKLMEDGALTKRDLQRWFGRPYPTVRLWITGKHLPWTVWEEEVEWKVEALQTLIAERRHLPMPASYSPTDRAELIGELIRVRDAKLSRTHSAARR